MHERRAAAAMRHREIGLQRERALEIRDRLGLTSGLSQGAAKVGLHGRIGRLQRRGRLEQAHGFVCLPKSCQSEA